jgi:predicted AAA+ superfamily ATPase
VVFELNENTRKREAEGLVEAAKALGLKDGTILSNDQEDSFTQESVRINVLPVWKWLLVGTGEK